MERIDEMQKIEEKSKEKETKLSKRKILVFSLRKLLEEKSDELEVLNVTRANRTDRSEQTEEDQRLVELLEAKEKLEQLFRRSIDDKTNLFGNFSGGIFEHFLFLIDLIEKQNEKVEFLTAELERQTKHREQEIRFELLHGFSSQNTFLFSSNSAIVEHFQSQIAKISENLQIREQQIKTFSEEIEKLVQDKNQHLETISTQQNSLLDEINQKNQILHQIEQQRSRFLFFLRFVASNFSSSFQREIRTRNPTSDETDRLF